MEEKPKPIFAQNENGKFENKGCSSPPVVDVEELKRENQLLKEKLFAIQKESEVSGGGSKPPRAVSACKGISASTEDISSKGNKKLSTRGRSNSFKGSDSYWHSWGPALLPCRYNPRCYSKSNMLHNEACDCLDHDYLSNMVNRYPDYFSRGHYWPRRGMRTTRSYEDVSRALELNALYNRVPSGRLRERTRSVEGLRPTSGRLTPQASIHYARMRGRTCEEPLWVDDPYFSERWKNAYPRIPFRPRTAWDLSPGMRVSMHRSDGRLSRGIIRWIGLLPNLVGDYVGVELETQTGRHDGYLNGVRYFKCRENCGIFVRFSKIIMAWR